MNTTDRHDRRARRGMLLLLVLSMLTLFLLMGAMAIALAMRARESARAFSTVVSGSGSRAMIARSMLDEALLLLLRGSPDQSVKTEVSESLFGDMYPGGALGQAQVPFVNEAHDAVESDSFLKGYAGNNSEKKVDNDGDGEFDSVWLEDVLPAVTSVGGGRMTFRVSYLVRDLDGRINVNAHGSTVPNDPNVPLGPASVDASDVFGNVWSRVTGTSATPPVGTAPTQSQWRPAPALGTGITIQGRYGGRSPSTYAIRLDREAPRPAVIFGATNANPYTLGEVERVLRPFDADAATLPPRLAAILDNQAEAVRLLITTESWDVTGKTGRAAEGLQAPEARFNLNRPVANETDKQQYVNDLLAELVKSGVANDDETKGWVGKVAEFRAQREFTSVGELLTIPIGSEPEKRMSLAARASNDTGRRIFETVIVPSRFTNTTLVNPWWEPGRVNVNTCDDRVWKAVCGKGGVVRPSKTITSLWQLLVETAGGEVDAEAVDTDLANRLASIATVRSNVYAIWITLEIDDAGSPLAPPPSCHRLFAIVDRSIPVSYREGESRNVRDAIRLERFVE